GIIVHGLCTMAFVGRAVVDNVGGGDPTRLCRLAVRFSRPVLPGSRIHSRVWALPTGGVGGEAAFGFETSTDDGGVVLKDGLGLVTAESRQSTGTDNHGR
ncbi:MAG: MaoC/PaaZ C-terminal domain-containing protein, partial [Acidimicrobiia bacterium]